MVKGLAIKILVAIISCYSTCSFADVQSTREVLSHSSLNNPKVLEAYDRVTKSWVEYERSHKEFVVEKLLKAIEFAAEKHECRVRDDSENTLSIIYPIEVSEILWIYASIRNINILTSALLLDTLEINGVTEVEIKTLFGSRIFATLKEVTADPTLSIIENKHRQIENAPMMSLDGQLVILAGCLYNARYPLFPDWTEDDIYEHYRWSEGLLSTLKGTNEKLEIALLGKINDYKNNINGSHTILSGGPRGYFSEYHGWIYSSFDLVLDNDTRWNIDIAIVEQRHLNLKGGEKIEITTHFGDQYLMKFSLSETANTQSLIFNKIQDKLFSAPANQNR